MKILFIIPKIDNSQIKGEYPHIGVGYLSEVLLQNKINHEVIDMTLGYEQDYLIGYIKKYEPDVIAITTYSYRFNNTKSIIELLIKNKQQFDYKILLGGPHVSCLRKESMFEGVDFEIKGEGEETLKEFCKSFDKKNRDYSKILGLIWRKYDKKIKSSKIIENPDRPWITDLDKIPFPKYTKFEFQKYICYNDRYIRINTSRGCPYQCIFCSVKFVTGNQFRARSPKNLLEEIHYWYDHGFKTFEFVDDNFTLNKKRVIEFCNLLRNENLKITFNLFGGVRVDRVDKELLITMKKCGLNKIIYGVETTNEQVLKNMKKAITLQQIKNTFKLTRELLIPFGAFFSIGHPGQTYKDVIEDLKFIKKQKIHSITYCNMVPYPGSELEKWVDLNAEYIIPKNQFLESVSYSSDMPIYATKEFNKYERIKALKKAHSFCKKELFKMKLGPLLGTSFWLITKINFFDNLVNKLLNTNVGRFIFNLIKRDD